MKAHIVRIGNSRGIRLPKALLQEAQLEDEVELQAEPGRILISKTAKPRAGWAEAARRMRARGHDLLLDLPTPTQFDKEEWKWR
jgi:antitoxin MazE